MAYTDLHTLATDGVFLGRIAVAATKKAVSIASESSGGLNPARKRLAVLVLKNALSEAEGLGFLVVRDPTIAAKTPPIDPVTGVSDAEIDAALSDAVWDGYAEAFAG